MNDIYDILIIGGGPAGITAGIYAKRAGKKVAIFEKFVPGGQVAQIGEIENYTGFTKVSGFDLAQNFYNHAKSLGLQFLMEEVKSVDLSGEVKKIFTKKNEYKAKAVILATGCRTRELNINGEQEFKGRGVSYCAVCDGNFFKEQEVAVIGSGDSAVSDAIYLAGICKTVYVLTKNGFKVSNYSQDELDKCENVEVLNSAMSAQILGSDKVESLIFEQDNKKKELKLSAVFVAIGRTPDTEFLKGQVELNEKGYVKANADLMTSASGVFVCGDIREGSIRQIVCATSDGALAVTKAMQFLR